MVWEGPVRKSGRPYPDSGKAFVYGGWQNSPYGGKMKTLDKRYIGLLLLILGVLAAFLVYLPGLNGGFFFDDHPNIADNPSVKLGDLSWESFRSAWSGGTSGQFGRPVSQLSFALNFYFSGFSPFAFKLTNLIIHCLNGVLVFLLAYQLLDSIRQRLNAGYVGVYAALLACAWLLHPIQLTSVLYAVQRMTSLSVFFILAGLVFHVMARRRSDGWQGAAFLLIMAWGVCWPLSILSKETGVLLPGFVAAYELIIQRSERCQLDTTGRVFLVLSLIVLVGIIPYLASPFGQWFLSGYEIRSFSLVERLLTESRVIWAYLGWVAFPTLGSFALFHDDIVVSKSLTNPWSTLPALFGLFGLVLWVAFNSRRFPLAAFGILWFLIGHSLESTFIPLELVHEHRNYLPLLGILLVPVAWLDNLAAKPGATRTLAISLVAATLAYLGFITAMRAEMYANQLIRTQIEAQFHPDSARTNYEAGRSLASLADHGHNMIATILSKKHFEMSSALDPDYKMGLLGSLILACGVSQTVDQEALSELQRRFRERLILQEDTNILSTIVEMSGAGLLCLNRAEIDGLFAAFFANRKLASGMKMTMYSLHADYLWLKERDLSSARNALQQALEIAPNNPSLRLKWAQLDYIAGDRVSAKRLLLDLRGEPFSPGERETLNNLLNTLEAAPDK